MSRKMDMNFSDVWQCAESQGISKIKLAKHLGVSRQTLDNYIKGIADPGISLFRKACKFVGIDMDGNVKDFMQSEDYFGIHKRVWEKMEQAIEDYRSQIVNLNEDKAQYLQIISNLSKPAPQ